MKNRLPTIYWALLLIAGGALGLADNLGLLDNFSALAWAGAFAAASALGLIVYLLGGIRNWGMLFPVGVFGGLAFLLALTDRGFDGSAIVAPLLIGLGLPFLAAYFLNRENWWAIIPAGVMAFLVMVMFFADSQPGELIGAGLFFILALTFAAVYTSIRAWWALLAAYIMFVMSAVVLLAMGAPGEMAGTVMMTAISLPFLFLYFKAPQENWWAIIPGGIVGSVALVIAAAMLFEGSGNVLAGRIPAVLMYLGVAASFAVVWLRHHRSWAAVVSFIALGFAGLTGVIGEAFDNFLPVLLILGGLILLVQGLRKNTRSLEV
jgi:hypothetical protein